MGVHVPSKNQALVAEADLLISCVFLDGRCCSVWSTLREFLSFSVETFLKAEIYHIAKGAKMLWHETCCADVSVEVGRSCGISILSDIHNANAGRRRRCPTPCRMGPRARPMLGIAFSVTNVACVVQVAGCLGCGKHEDFFKS